MEEPTINDKYRQHYAIVAKHILSQTSKISLYQIQRFALSGNLIIKGASAGFSYLWKNHLKDKAVEIGKALLGSLTVFTGGIGVAIAIALGGLLYAFDTKNTETMQSKLKKALSDVEIQKIKAYLKAYQTCFDQVQDVKQYCQQIQSPGYLIALLSRMNYVYDVITGEELKDRSIDISIQVCALYYKLVKIIIQLHILIAPNKIQKLLDSLKIQHKKIKQIMVIQLKKYVKIKKNTVEIYNVSEKLAVQFYNRDQLMSSDLYLVEIFDQIFRCPFTKSPIQNILDAKIWTTKSQKTDADIQKLISQNKQNSHLGEKKNYSNKIVAGENSRIRQIDYNNKIHRWTGYYQNLQNKSGSHDHDYGLGDKQLEFDKINALFICEMQYQDMQFQDQFKFSFYTDLRTVNTNHEVIFIKRLYDKQLKISSEMDYCLQIDHLANVKTIKTQGEINFEFIYQPRQNKASFGPFKGFIATANKSYKLGFGSRNAWALNFVKGYTFHKWSEDDASQQLIFEAVTPIKYYSENQLSEFTCRITNQYDPTMKMVRDNRNEDTSVFGNNQAGGEILRIQLINKTGKGQYMGKIFVENGAYSTYLSSSNNLKWTKKDPPKQRQTIFYMRIKQE